MGLVTKGGQKWGGRSRMKSNSALENNCSKLTHQGCLRNKGGK